MFLNLVRGGEKKEELEKKKMKKNRRFDSNCFSEVLVYISLVLIFISTLSNCTFFSFFFFFFLILLFLSIRILVRKKERKTTHESHLKIGSLQQGRATTQATPI